jgi:hypothetical protein
VRSELVRKQAVDHFKIKKWQGRHSFGYFSLAVERKVTRRQGGTPTVKVTPSAHKRRIMTKQDG